MAMWVERHVLELSDTPGIIIRSEVIIITELMEILDSMGEGNEE